MTSGETVAGRLETDGAGRLPRISAADRQTTRRRLARIATDPAETLTVLAGLGLLLGHPEARINGVGWKEACRKPMIATFV